MKLLPVLSVVLFCLGGHSEETPKQPIFTDKAVLDKIRNGLKFVTQELEAVGIVYSIDSGSTLGAVRHGDVIPWDDDGDIVVLEQYREQVAALGQKWLAQGHIFWANDRSSGDKPFSKFFYKQWAGGGGIDIFFIQERDGAFVPSTEKFKGYRYEAGELFPLKRYRFGEFDVWGPNNPDPWLKRAYGENYMTEATVLVPGGTHHKDKLVARVRIADIIFDDHK